MLVGHLTTVPTPTRITNTSTSFVTFHRPHPPRLLLHPPIHHIRRTTPIHPSLHHTLRFLPTRLQHRLLKRLLPPQHLPRHVPQARARVCKNPCLVPQILAPIRSVAEAVDAVAPDDDLLRGSGGGGGWTEVGEDEEEDFGREGEEIWLLLSGVVGLWRVVWIAPMVFRVRCGGHWEVGVESLGYSMGVAGLRMQWGDNGASREERYKCWKDRERERHTIHLYKQVVSSAYTKLTHVGFVNWNPSQSR